MFSMQLLNQAHLRKKLEFNPSLQSLIGINHGKRGFLALIAVFFQFLRGFIQLPHYIKGFVLCSINE